MCYSLHVAVNVCINCSFLYLLHIKFPMSLFHYSFTYLLAINFWHLQFITADVSAVFSDEYKILTKSLYLMGYTAKRLTDEYPEKSWTKRRVNKLLKKLQDSGTVDRQPGSGRPRNACTKENVETVNDLVLSQEGPFKYKLFLSKSYPHC